MPFVFSAASLLAKDPKTGEAVPWNPSPQRWIDGSVDNDLPMTRLAEMFNVNHFIVSQVNPHVVPFLVKEEDSIAQQTQSSGSTIMSAPSWLYTVTHLAKGEALHRMHSVAELGIFPNMLTKAVSVLSQKYSGDITILPEISYADFPRMLSNPSPEFMRQAMLCGERATWPKLSRIRNHCAIELALDDAVQKLRARVVFSQSQTDLRLSGQPRERIGIGKSSSSRSQVRSRPLSHHATPLPTNGTVINPLRESKRGLERRLRHKKSSSLSTVLHRPAPLYPDTFLASNKTTPALAVTSNPEELTSSGAETSHLTTSPSSSSLSCSSPPEPESPPLEPSHHPTFYQSLSQPSTPTTYYANSMFGQRKPTPPPPHTPPRASSRSSLAMTPKITATSVPESKYKNISHKGTTDGQKQPTPATREATMAGSSKGRNWPLNIGLLGVKNPLSKKKMGQ